jgi:hypothetical protein
MNTNEQTINTESDLGRNGVLRRRAKELHLFLENQLSECLRKRHPSNHDDDLYFMARIWCQLKSEFEQFLGKAVEQEIRNVKKKRWTLKRFAMERAQLEGQIEQLMAERKHLIQIHKAENDKKEKEFALERQQWEVKIKELTAECGQVRDNILRFCKAEHERREELEKALKSERTICDGLINGFIQFRKDAEQKNEELKKELDEARRMRESNRETRCDQMSILARELDQEKERYAALLSVHEKCAEACTSNLGATGAPFKSANWNDREIESGLREAIGGPEEVEEVVKEDGCNVSEADEEDDMSSWVNVMGDCV